MMKMLMIENIGLKIIYNMKNKVYFLITSYLGGNNSLSKKEHLVKYIYQIRKYFPNSYILLIDSINDYDLSKMCDLYVCENENYNIPYGQADLTKIKIGLSIFEGTSVKWFIRSSYDYWINDTIYNKITEWSRILLNGAKVVVPRWKAGSNDIAYLNDSASTGYGCFTVEGARKLFNDWDFENNELIVEGQFYNKILNTLTENEYYIYNSNEEMFGCMIFDVFNNRGDKINTDRLSLID
jgi:hypothetical protein